MDSGPTFVVVALYHPSIIDLPRHGRPSAVLKSRLAVAAFAFAVTAALASTGAKADDAAAPATTVTTPAAVPLAAVLPPEVNDTIAKVVGTMEVDQSRTEQTAMHYDASA